MFGYAHVHAIGWDFQTIRDAANQTKLKPVIRFAAGGRFSA
jgi:hypothetical protein